MSGSGPYPLNEALNDALPLNFYFLTVFCVGSAAKLTTRNESTTRKMPAVYSGVRPYPGSGQIKKSNANETGM
jgi:hypothetical protein